MFVSEISSDTYVKLLVYSEGVARMSNLIHSGSMQEILSGLRQLREAIASINPSERGNLPVAEISINYDVNAGRCRLNIDIPIVLTYNSEIKCDVIQVVDFLP